MSSLPTHRLEPYQNRYYAEMLQFQIPVRPYCESISHIFQFVIIYFEFRVILIYYRAEFGQLGHFSDLAVFDFENYFSAGGYGSPAS